MQECKGDKMNIKRKSILINRIIGILNSILKKENKKLCSENLAYQQKPLHGVDMFFNLTFISDKELIKIAQACGA